MKYRTFVCMALLCTETVFGQHRSFNDIFPNYDEAKREQVFSPEGMLKTTNNVHALQLLPAALADMNIEEPVLRRRPSFLVESLMVIPGMRNPVEPLTVYNALGRVRDLKGRLYHSYNRERDIPLFEDASRLESARRLSPIPDPPAARSIPAAEIMFLRLRDANFGNSFYRADITAYPRGILYSLSNFKNLSYLFIPVIKEDKFIAQLYVEPLLDGIFVYSVAGADVSDFVASKIDVPSAIQKRLAVIIDWVIDGIKNSP